MVKRTAILALTMVMILVMIVPAAAKYDADRPQGGNKYGNSLYIVQMIDAPVTAYTGGIQGYKATKPAKGQKINPLAQDVIKYAAYLDGKHNAALASTGGRKIYSYHYVFNGFAAELSAAQTEMMKNAAGVVAVTKNEYQTVDTSSTPTFLGLNAAGGLWSQLGGVGKAGENIIIGDVDTGIWPEHPSFSDRTGSNPNGKPGKLNYKQIPGWNGKCTPGEAFNASNCNQKLIGAQYFNAGFGGNAGIDLNYPWEFNSPRDFGGHGTHTASTAGGNYGVPATGLAAAFGAISGMAPRARIAMYKVCWYVDPATGSCATVDSVAAIDQAVADGVDVINFSISGTTTNFLDPVEVAFLFAADAGVFVATSAGNSGPASSTVAHPGPWETTVAAGTHNRDGSGSVTLGGVNTYYGASVANAVGPVLLIDSETAGLPTATPTEARLCFLGALDPAKVAGKIVVCDRGTNARVDKSHEVLNTGGVGMILLNTSVNSMNADFHFVPTVHLQVTDRAAVKAYAATPGATAKINQSTIVYTAPAPFTASFSSRGPLRAAGGDLLKPDVIAPGQDILAAVAPPGNAGRLFDVYSGTSMSSPHVAGLAALLKNLHPNWSPMMIKSALMTSAGDVLDGPNTDPLVIFRQGGGHVKPNLAANPGLVFDSGFFDWLAFLCGTKQLTASYCPSIAIDPSDLNMASIAIGDLAGSQMVTRTATNVGSGAATYTPIVSGMLGVDVVVTPASLTLSPGASGSFDVTFTTNGALLNAYVGGQLTWSDGTHSVRMPMVVKPVALAAPAQVNGNGSPLSFDVKFGYNGTFTVAARGLVPAVTTAGSVADDPGDVFAPGGLGTVSFDIVIPAGTTYARFSLFNGDVCAGCDLDLYVYSGSTLVGVSGGGTSDEEVNFLSPGAGTLKVWVHGYGVPSGTTSFVLYSWVLGSTDAGNMIVAAPATATIGTLGTINLTFTGLAGVTKYLGSLVYGGAAGMPNPTIVRIDTP